MSLGLRQALSGAEEFLQWIMEQGSAGTEKRGLGQNGSFRGWDVELWLKTQVLEEGSGLDVKLEAGAGLEART